MTQQQEKVCAICGCGLCELLSRDLLSLHSWAQSIQSLMKQVVNCTKWNADRRFLSMFHYSQVPPFPKHKQFAQLPLFSSCHLRFIGC